MSFDAASTLASILFGAGLTVLVATLLGRVLLARLFGSEPVLTRAEGWVFSLAVGSALLSQGIFYLCALGLVYDGVFLAVAAAVVGAWWRWGRGLGESPAARPERDARIWWGLLAALSLAYAYIYIPHALAPEIQADAVGYHLGLVGHTYRAHGFPGITTNIYAFLSQGSEMLYLYAYAFGRHTAAKLFHFSLFAATLVAIVTFARRYGVARAGAVGAGLYLCAPVVGTDATSAYNDCALAFFAFMAFYAATVWWRDRGPGWMVVLGVLGGFCFSIKYTGIFAIPVLMAVVGWGTWRRLRDGQRALRRLVLVGLVASFFVVPWFAKNTITTGNPVAPFYNKYFPNPYVSVSWEKGYRNLLAGYSHDPEVRRKNLIAAPLELTVRGIHFQGLVGPVFLIAPILLLAWRHPLWRPLMLAAVVAVVPWFSNTGTRFLLPALVFVSIGMGLALYRLPRRTSIVAGVALLAFHGTMSWPSVIPKWHPEGLWALQGAPWAAALRLEPEAEYLRRWVPWYRTAEFIAQVGDSETRVLSFEPLPEAYFSARLWVSFQGARNEAMMRVLLAGSVHDFWPSRKLAVEWPSQELSGVRIVQQGSHETSEWSLSEIQLFTGEEEVVPQVDWEIRAKPFPWGARRAFDGNPWTPWITWEPVQPNTFIELTFPRSLRLSRMVVTHPTSQHFSKFEYFGSDGHSEWHRLEATSSEEFRPVRLAEGRAWAGEELRRQGIDYLVGNTAEGAIYGVIMPAIESDPAAWGLERVFEDGPMRVYRVLGAATL